MNTSIKGKKNKILCSGSWGRSFNTFNHEYIYDIYYYKASRLSKHFASWRAGVVVLLAAGARWACWGCSSLDVGEVRYLTSSRAMTTIGGM
jgi:hypothetical protein